MLNNYSYLQLSLNWFSLSKIASSYMSGFKSQLSTAMRGESIINFMQGNPMKEIFLNQ